MQLVVPQEVKDIIKQVTDAGYDIYIVGGAVRDILLGKNVVDWDFATNAKPEDVQNIFPDSFYDNKFGTVGIQSKNQDLKPFEITTYRTEHGYSDARRPDVIKWGKTIEEDLQRRDFTINALAFKQESKRAGNFKLIDLYNGKADLKNKIIRAVGDPNERFGEDALRMIRAVRIAAELGFIIDLATIEAIKTNATLINKIAKERVKSELMKLLSSYYPYEGILIFRNVGLMQEILPELEKTFGVEQKSPGRHHVHDVGTHSLLSLKYVAERNKDPIVRFATLVHDIGKPQTYKKLKSGVITFYNHEIVSGKIARRIADRLRFSNAEFDKFFKLVRYHQFTVDERQTDSAIRRFIRKVGPENIPDMLDLRVGDRLGGGARETSWRLEEFKERLIEVQKQPFSIRDLKITGHEIMNLLDLKPGPQVGKILNDLFQKVVDKKIDNNKKDLTKEVKN